MKMLFDRWKIELLAFSGVFVLSLSLNKESTKESQLKGLMPLRNPQDFSLSLSFGGYQKALWHLRVLRNEIQRFRCYCKQAISPHFTPRRASKRIEEKNIYAFSASLAVSHHARQAKKAKIVDFSVGAGASTARFSGRQRNKIVFV